MEIETLFQRQGEHLPELMDNSINRRIAMMVRRN